jgi:negative regulator of sigma E activity
MVVQILETNYCRTTSYGPLEKKNRIDLKEANITIQMRLLVDNLQYTQALHAEK